MGKKILTPEEWPSAGDCWLGVPFHEGSFAGVMPGGVGEIKAKEWYLQPGPIPTEPIADNETVLVIRFRQVPLRPKVGT